MSIWRLRRPVQFHISGGQHLGKLPERLGAARPLVIINHIRVMPFFQLHNLVHFRKYTDTPLRRRRQQLITRDVSKIPAKFKHLHPRRLFKFDIVAVRSRPGKAA